MNIRIREQAGTDSVRKFDYQMAVALDYLLSEIDSDTIILIETLEDFAVFRNHGTEFEEIEIYQVKTKNSGLYEKRTLLSDNVLGKIILTDFYFNSKSKTLNIVCNTPLKGASTETLDNFVFENSLTPKELTELKLNVKTYLSKESDFTGSLESYWGKLIYIKSSLPFSGKEDRYSETLVGKTNSVISHYLGDENHSINPQIVFNTLRLLIDKQRRNKITTSEIDVEDALSQKGIRTSDVKAVIDQAAKFQHLTKNEIFQHASQIFSPAEFLAIKSEYPTFLSYRANLSDQAYQDALKILQEEYWSLTAKYDSLDEIIRITAQNCCQKIPYYSLAIIQIMAIVIVYS
ncbi:MULTISPECIES: dsDNA nuclease domain-containing protein [unclassified Oscillibacter]|uniref:dsDNA nuclease domain-containing protein n=1 Tax=unclassified Oscillibacter TaxID=2629304 RepID=UPI0003AD9B00|nr:MULTISPECIES: dsDNA nuclease domain-containing protein [unclassified Oscillibacter]ERK62059.1 hypothetical protein HMPREF1545_01364 [Oscillibacter sp. KLE 1728]ERK64911.1 hypothetical protein HMPREF1546_01502 [Oscillibacter sp. KLE 1745]GBF70952.1 hypothetical protein LAWASA_3691 [Lawsonibacter asaccharolyticus]GBF71447.1 hypothetical protein LAWASA_4205 [Lawsonibacter asaccharolyticus]